MTNLTPEQMMAHVKLLRAALGMYNDAYPHLKPYDCFATGPLTGDPIQDLVTCPGCGAEKLATEALAATDRPEYQEEEG